MTVEQTSSTILQVIRLPESVRSALHISTQLSIISTTMLLTTNAIFFTVTTLDIDPGNPLIAVIMGILPTILIISSILGNNISKTIHQIEFQHSPSEAPIQIRSTTDISTYGTTNSGTLLFSL